MMVLLSEHHAVLSYALQVCMIRSYAVCQEHFLIYMNVTVSSLQFVVNLRIGVIVDKQSI